MPNSFGINLTVVSVSFDTTLAIKSPVQASNLQALSVIITTTSSLEVSPSLSVTTNVTKCSPTVNIIEGVAPLPISRSFSNHA